MKNVGDIIVYKKDVCKIVNIINNYFNNKDYYDLVPMYDNTLSIKVPVDSSLIRDVISKEKALSLINDVNNIKPLNINDKFIENEYKKLLESNNLENLFIIIKTTYMRNSDRVLNGKKEGERDNNYLHKCEQILFNELAVSLNLSFDEVKEMIINIASKDKNE
ncbi:MAG: CarD family transcriptional regulator [Bacilli bacterium]|nr:CarD family transcriptional regulator [Bacilli bacterium]